MAEVPIRDRKTRETRARIGEAALHLFVTQGYVETTIDQIAAAAGVGRRTVFRHFATKEAILLDHLAGKAEAIIEHLRERPLEEPPLMSMLAVLREQSRHGYERPLLDQIRAVLAANPTLARDELSIANWSFRRTVVATLQERCGAEVSQLELHAITHMAFGWFVAAVQIFLLECRPSLEQTFDEVVDACTRAAAGARG